MADARPAAGVGKHRYVPAGQVAWTVEADGVVVVDLRRGISRHIRYPHAAVWDLLCQGVPRARMTRMVKAVAGSDGRSAARLIDECLRQWAEAGLLAEGAEHG